jgi:hypothetical protein
VLPPLSWLYLLDRESCPDYRSHDRAAPKVCLDQPVGATAPSPRDLRWASRLMRVQPNKGPLRLFY